MASLGMSGPYSFIRETVIRTIEEGRLGNYALGYEEDGSFYVKYVGRSDHDLRRRLLEHIRNEENYSSFKYSYASSPKAAFEKECQNYHDFGGDRGKLDNEYHPDEPEGGRWKCPVCG